MGGPSTAPQGNGAIVISGAMDTSSPSHLRRPHYLSIPLTASLVTGINRPMPRDTSRVLGQGSRSVGQRHTEYPVTLGLTVTVAVALRSIRPLSTAGDCL